MRPFDSNGVFIPINRGGGLRQSAVRSAGVTIFAQGLTFVAQMASTVILARLLMPADFGVVTMVTTFSVLLVSCGHIGFPDAILQREDLDDALASNIFWINLAVGLLLTLVFAASGTLLAKFYGDWRIARIVSVVSLSILFDSTSALHLALLKRAMRFSVVSANDILSRIVAVAASIILGLAGWGYWALVAGVVVYPLSVAVGAWSRCLWVPGLPKRVTGTGSMVRFAAQVLARFSFGYVTQNTDNLLVGWRFGPSALGFYKKAYDLFVLPFNLLTIYPVAVATLSRLNGDRVQYKRYLLGGLSILALVGMALAGDLTLIGNDVVRVVLGPRWEASGRIFMLFGPGIGAMLIYSTHGMIHLSLGTTGRFFRWGIFEFTITLLLFLLTLRWGPQGIAAAWTASYWILLIPGFWYAGQPIFLSVSEVLGAVWRCMLASLLAASACFLIMPILPPTMATKGGTMDALAKVIVKSLIFGAFYCGAIICLYRSTAPLRQLMNLVRELVPYHRFVKQSSPIESGSAAGVN